MHKSEQNEYNRNGLNVRIVKPVLEDQEQSSAELKIIKSLKREFNAIMLHKKKSLQ